MAHNPERYQEKAVIPDATPAKIVGNVNRAAEILDKVLPESNAPETKDAEEKSFLDTVKDFFTGKDEKAQMISQGTCLEGIDKIDQFAGSSTFGHKDKGICWADLFSKTVV